MPKILFDNTRINKTDIVLHTDLINKIITRSLRYPNVKKLAGAQYNNEDVFRAKIDKKNRLIYTYVLHEGQKTLLVLSLNDHNYGQVKRQLRSTHTTSLEAITIEEDLYKDAPEPTEGELSLLPAVSYNKLTLALDSDQQKGMLQKTPLILNGPPGAGKTVILYNLMLKILNYFASELGLESAIPDKHDSSSVLFISQSENLINSLKSQHESKKSDSTPKVKFSTWLDLLQQHYPDYKPIKDEEFINWLKENCPKEPCDMVHYELSLIAALGTKKYMELGNRQCYYSKTPEKQKRLIELLERWQHYLVKNKRIDPMVTRLNRPKDQKFRSVFCDEAQNLPPVALCDLIEFAEDQHFVACLDSEQCLISSPYIHSCLKELLHQNYGAYSEHPLPKTWRCPPEVAKVANFLMQMKYKLDGGGKRRNYNSIESMHATGGLVSWVNNKGLAQLHQFGSLAGTVVIAEHLEPGDRDFINKHLGTNNILTARQAIGLDFDRVILWKPISSIRCFHDLAQKMQKSDYSGLTLEQWNTLNALYVSITRSQSDVFVYETNNHSMAIGEQFLGKLPLNEQSSALNTKNPEQEQLKWKQAVDFHLIEGRESLARELMKFHLKMTPAEIEEKIMSRKTVKNNSETLPLPHSAAASAAVAPPTDNLTKLKSEDAPPRRSKRKNKIVQSQKEPAPAPAPAPANSNLKSTVQEVSNNKNTPPKADETMSKEVLVSQTDIYIYSLLNQLSEKNINNLFQHKSAIKYLFQSPLKDGACLFTKLVHNKEFIKVVLSNVTKYWDSLSQGLTPELLCQSNPPGDVSNILLLSAHPEGIAILNKVLHCHPNLAKDFSAATLTHVPTTIRSLTGIHKVSAFHKLLTYLDGRKFLNTLIDLYPECANSIDVNFFNFSRKAAGIVNKEVVSPLYWITASPSGLTLFKKLINQNPNLGKAISGEALGKKQKKINNIQANTSPLYNLLASPEGRSIIHKLLDLNPGLAKDITAKALSRPLAPQLGDEGNASGLFWLLSSVDGRLLMNRLLDLNPELAKGIDITALCRPRLNKKGSNNYQFPIYYAVFSSDGLVLLNRMFDLNPELAKNFSVDTLCKTFPSKDGKTYDSSLLYVLSGSPDGRKFLIRLLAANPTLVKGITSKILCQTISTKTSQAYNSSPLYWFCGGGIDGYNILNTLFDLNPTLAKEISAKDLCKPISMNAISYAFASPLYWLCINPDGKKFLSKLIDINPELIKDLTDEDLCRIVKSPDENESNVSPLYWLSMNADGRELLLRILTINPNLGKTISGTFFNMRLPSNLANTVNTTPLFWCATDVTGRKILLTLLDRNPALIKDISGEALSLARSADSLRNANLSPLFLFSRTPDGQLLLYKMIDANTQLAKTISPQTLCLVNKVENRDDYNTSTFYWLSSTVVGRKILMKLFENNPEMAKGLSIDVLGIKRNSVGKYADTTPFSWLASCTDGIEILNLILDQNPELAKGINVECLSKEGVVSVQENTKESPLKLLSKSEAGEQVIQKLVKNNSELAEVAYPQKQTEDALPQVSKMGVFAPKARSLLREGVSIHNNYSINTRVQPT